MMMNGLIIGFLTGMLIGGVTGGYLMYQFMEYLKKKNAPKGKETWL